MHYSHEITVSTSDTAEDPQVFHIKLASGFLKEMQTVFEVGDGYSSCVTLWDRGKQLLPTNPDGFFCGDGVNIFSPIHYDLDAEDNDLYIVAWNRGGVYDHAVNIMLSVQGVDEPDITGLMGLMNSTINRLITLCRDLI
jgi:hypothetical protein